MLEVKACPDCGKLYLTFAGRVCAKCHALRQQQLNNTLELVRSQPGLLLSEVGRLCDVSEQVLQDFAEEGTFRRLNLSVLYSCRFCSAQINNGTICSKCNEELTRHIVDLRRKLQNERGILRPIQVSGKYETAFSPSPYEDPTKRREAFDAIFTRRSNNRRSLRHAGHIR